MFDSIGWGEIVVILLGGLFIFGPERLPGLAKDAAAALAQVRTAMRKVRQQVDETLGDDLADIHHYDFGHYRPGRLIREQIFGDESDV